MTALEHRDRLSWSQEEGQNGNPRREEKGGSGRGCGFNESCMWPEVSADTIAAMCVPDD